MLLEHRDHVDRRIRDDDGRPIGIAAIATHRLLDLVGRERDDGAELLERGAQRIGAWREERYRVAREVLGDDVPGAIVDLAGSGIARSRFSCDCSL